MPGGCESGAFVRDVTARVCDRAAVKIITQKKGSAMQQLVKQLWRDEAGFVVSTELVLIATIVVIGMVTGLTTVRDAVVTELADVAGAVAEIDQSYSWGAITAHCASTAGSEFVDLPDFCDAAVEGEQGNAGTGQCVAICLPPTGGEGGTAAGL